MQQFLLRTLQTTVIRAAMLWELAESGVTFNPLSPGFRSNPYPTYRKYREMDPVHRSRIVDGWILSRYADIDAIMRDHRRFSNDRRKASNKNIGNRRTDTPSMLRVDPPDHTRLRFLAAKAFTPNAVERIRPLIDAKADELLATIGDAKNFEVINDFAVPLTVYAIAALLRIPTEDQVRFSMWSRNMERELEPAISKNETLKLRETRVELEKYFNAIVDQRRANPSDDLVSELIVAEEKGDKLTHDELISTLHLLLVAGNITTANLIGNGLVALIRNPGEMRRLRNEPGIMDNAIEELLRYDGPVQVDGRVALENVEIGGKHIKKGQFVFLLLGQANRDPEIYLDPDILDLGRSGKQHYAFGRGIHYCLGAPLARMTAQIAFRKLLDRYTEIQLQGEPVYSAGLVLRGLKSLPVSVVRSKVLA